MTAARISLDFDQFSNGSFVYSLRRPDLLVFDYFIVAIMFHRLIRWNGP